MHTEKIDDRWLVALGGACIAGSFLILKGDRSRQQRRRKLAIARSLHPSVWSHTPNAPRTEVLLRAESTLAHLRFEGRIDQMTYQDQMSRLASNSDSALLP